MKRIEKAYMKFPDGIVLHKSEALTSDTKILDCCPYYIDCGEDDLDELSVVGKIGNVKGCRGITCEQCWNKEAY